MAVFQSDFAISHSHQQHHPFFTDEETHIIGKRGWNFVMVLYLKSHFFKKVFTVETNERAIEVIGEEETII